MPTDKTVAQAGITLHDTIIIVPGGPHKDLAFAEKIPPPYDEWLDGPFCCDNCFEGQPEEPGVYRCEVHFHAWGDEDPDFEFRVTNAEKIYSW